ncbi:PREDICTED: rac guanine nucleotide exchange factor B-like [Amphimedon queenslandica]|uniref:Transgelin n=3 Tax=Amphimedon queenslandica TaxID=400682 RepID=A0AAN0IHK6_AMPQE|nr:PREDICTED: rac guanine nucleotide exchange factor B-like [Amphimedon queenslandica]|eukprot:XP_003389350.2 PREDICTED: rac guanine nucleotide exchange factor B-like [Amphimedon queenslandica]
MADRPKGFGMTAELNEKKAAKFDSTRAQEALDWIEEIIGEPTESDGTSPEGFAAGLKSGDKLCNLINIIKPGSVKKINTSKMAFKQMENIGNFLTGCEGIGMIKTDLFQTVDLYEAQNVPLVVDTIHALGRKVQTFRDDLPILGPKESEANKREFTKEQLEAGKNIIGLQAGTNKGASQAGMSFGTTRQINPAPPKRGSERAVLQEDVMAVRPKGYGLTAELNAKKDSKFDINLAQDAFLWIEELLGEPITVPEEPEKVKEILKDGIILCMLANLILPGSIERINRNKLKAFTMMENISNFLSFCERFGLKRSDLFQTVDLYEGQNIPQVISTIHALGRKVAIKRKDLPSLGPKESVKAPRTFTNEQLTAGQQIIGLQMGSNRGANQSGINFGLQRQIFNN